MFSYCYRSEVLRIERELNEARNKLVAIRQAKSHLRGGNTSGEETDGYASPPPAVYEGFTSR